MGSIVATVAIIKGEDRMAITLDSIDIKRLAFLGLIEIITFKRFIEVWARAR